MELKRTVKRKIYEKIEETAKLTEKEKRKMRHQIEQTFVRKPYLQGLGVQEASRTIRRRLEMYEVGNNMGKGRICRCGIKETVEHVINCAGIQMEDRIRKEWLKEVKDVEKIRKVNKWIEIYIEKREKQN